MAALMGKRVVVVGGSSGIGLGVAMAALQRGGDLIIVGRSQAKLQAAERTLAAHGSVRTIAGDMTLRTTDRQAVRRSRRIRSSRVHRRTSTARRSPSFAPTWTL